MFSSGMEPLLQLISLKTEVIVVIFRKAQSDDIEDLIKMRLAYLTEDINVNRPIKDEIFEQLSRYFSSHLSHDCIAFVAHNDHLVVSTAFLIIQEKPANHRFPTGKTGLLLNVYTLPEYRRQGIATSLLKILINEAKFYDL